MIIRTRLQYDRDHDRWRWTYCDDWSRYYATNSDGRGVFHVNEETEEVIVIETETEFSVAGLSDASAKDKIRRYMTK